MRIPAAALAALVLLAGPAAPQEEKEDLLFKVMRHEIDRSMARLKLDGSPAPYYVRYSITDQDSFQVTASFGAVTALGGGRQRSLDVDLRVGDPSLDNTNFAEAGEGGGARLSVDDDYDALRHGVWLATDATYKAAVEALEKKKAYLAQHSIADRPPDFSKEEPVSHLQSARKLEVDREKWTAISRRVSAVFRDQAHVQKSFVQFASAVQTRWFLSSEGFRHRASKGDAGLIILAAAQADDGMKVVDYEMLTFPDPGRLPPEEELVAAAKGVAARLKLLREAPAFSEEYAGPVLLEGPAAADFFAALLPGNLGYSHQPVGARNPNAGNQWRDKLGQRVMPAFLNVTSDPTAREFGGRPLAGGYEVDDDGIRARKLPLIERGKLKTFCMSRIPTRQIAASNGHSRAGVGAVSTLFVESTKRMDRAGLRARLGELAQDEDLPHVYICRKIASPLVQYADPVGWFSTMMARGGILLPPPVLLYRVNPADGSETLVRGARFKKLELRVLRDIVATGDDPAVYTPYAQNLNDVSIVTPSILVKEMELGKPSSEMEKLPAYPHPDLGAK